MSNAAFVSILLIAVGFFILWWCEQRDNKRLRHELATVTLDRDGWKSTAIKYTETINRQRDSQETVTADRDRWQVEAAKRLAISERQASDIVQLQVALRSAQRANGVRHSNR